MAAYSNYQIPQFAQPPGQPYQQASPQNSVGYQQQQGGFSPYASTSTAPDHRMAPLRSLSFGSAKEAVRQQQQQQQQTALVSFDPYASSTQQPVPPATPTAYNTNNYSTNNNMYTPTGAPPTFAGEEMTTSPHANFGFAQSSPQLPTPSQQSQQQQQAFHPNASTVSDMTMFTNAPAPAATSNSNAIVPAGEGEVSESSVDPNLIAEQERIWQDIQDRRKMERIRADGGIPNPRAIIPRQPPARSRSMPHQDGTTRGQENSLAHGGVAVLDPKKDRRKQTRKMKTAGGAVGGAVVGGLILGPVGVVLGAGGGAAVSNKMAKSRDKRKQAEFEQRNFQKGAANSAAAKGDGAFV